MGRKWRPRSPENVVEEIEELVKKYGIEELDFEDDNLTLDRKRAERIFDLIVEKELKIEWVASNGVRADTLDESLLRKMKASGCVWIYVAPESGSQEVVDKIVGKKLNLNKVEEAVKLCKKVGIGVGCYFVIGLPGETKEDIEKTIEFGRKLRSLGAEACSFFIANPFYGTQLYKISRENKYITRSDGKEIEEGFLNLEAMIKTPEFTPEEIYKFREKAMGEQDMSLVVSRMKSFSGIKSILFASIRSPRAALKYLYRMRHSLFKRK